MNGIELGQTSGLGREIVGRIARGDFKYLDPDVVNALVPHLPITMIQFLNAYGFALAIPTAGKMPPEIIEKWPHMDPEDQRYILRVARRAPIVDGWEGESPQ